MMNVYAYKNKLAQFWTLPTFLESVPESMSKTIRRMCVLDPVKFKQNHLDEVDLYYLGSFDEDTGKFELLDSPKFLVDCRDVFTQVSEALRHGGE